LFETRWATENTDYSLILIRHKRIEIELKDMLNVVRRRMIMPQVGFFWVLRGITARGSTMREQRQKAYRRGHQAEWLAVLLLRLKGYHLLARRLRTPVGEIDLVVRRGRRLAFVEVKRRKSRDEAAAAVTPHQQQRIRRAAAFWLARNGMKGVEDIGFDVILLSPARLPQHLVDAFPPAT
jgi:putative endonuclease